MAKVSALIITGYGTNCEIESEHAAKISGAEKTKIVHFSDLISSKVHLADYNFLIFPGGFLDGDDLGAAQAAAQRWQYAKTADGTLLIDQLKSFMDKKGLAIGICNGFQLMLKLGLLPALDGKYFERQCSLAHNASARYENRWCHLKVNPNSPCIFTKGLSFLHLPIRHGEGRFVTKDQETFEHLIQNNQIVLQYINPDSKEITESYPDNPNGSPLGIAGICDPSGHILGLMPHPEAFNHITNHPHPMTAKAENFTIGVSLFKNAVDYLHSL